MTIRTLDNGLSLIDLDFQGSPGVIASYLVEEDGERALIETGPTSTLDALVAGLREIDVEPDTISKLLVTHIHLDHAGASGTWIRRFPGAQLFVHENGVRHMVDPSKLLSSATRIWGDMMGPLWGDFEPVPEKSIHALRDGDVISVGSRDLTVLYTPGHASHHVTFYDEERAAVFTGDVAAVRLQNMEYVRPPTPPPDVDLEAWDRSIDCLRQLRPRSLNLTHYGPFIDVDRHLDDARSRLHDWGEIVRRAAESGQDRLEILDRLLRLGDGEILCERDDAETVHRYELATPYGMTVDGYLRYWRKRAEGA